MNKDTNISAGNGWFFPTLTIVFIVLKLTGQIDWSWLWVLSPLWLPLSLIVLVLVVFAIFVLLVGK